MSKEVKIKRGFNWCSVALAALTLGVGLAISGVASADIVGNENESNSGIQSNSSSVVDQSAVSSSSAADVSSTSNTSASVVSSATTESSSASQVSESSASNATNVYTSSNNSQNVESTTDLGDASSDELTVAKSAATAVYDATGVSQKITVKSAEAATTVRKKTGWYTNGNSNVQRYYQNGQLANGYINDGSNWYLFKNGVRQTDVQQWAGSYYYFDHNTYLRVDNNYVKSNWGDYYLFGNDGRIQTDVQQWAGTYYYFDHYTYLRTDNKYMKSSWGDYYLFGNDGRAQTDVQKWAGSYYYFDHNTFLRVDNKYMKSNWGNWYLFTDSGRIASGWITYGYSSYYFNPYTYLLEKTISSNVVGGVDSWTIGDPMRPQVSAIDVSSYQSKLTQANYNEMKKLGVKTVIIKLTEGTTYLNSQAITQIGMAQKAGLHVALYDYAKFNTRSSAESEARYMVSCLNTFFNNQKKYGISISKDITIIADMEDTATYSSDVAGNLNAFWNVLNANQYTNHVVYTYVTYKYRDAVVGTVGKDKTWIAQYPYSPLSNTSWNSSYGAWQVSSQAYLPGYAENLDVSVDYNSLLTNM